MVKTYKTNSSDALKRSADNIDSATTFILILTGDLQSFINSSNKFWEHDDMSSNYLSKAIVYGKHQIVDYIIDTCIEKLKEDNSRLIKILSRGLTTACETQDTKSALYILAKLKIYCNDQQYYDIINQSIIKSVDKYSKETPDISFIKLFIDAGADINYTSVDAPYSLIGAALYANKGMLVQTLIEFPEFDMLKHQPPYAEYTLLTTLLSNMTIDNHIKIRLLERFIELGADINAKGCGVKDQSFSPAGIACTNGSVQELFILVNAGVDLYAKDISGNSVIDYAKTLKKNESNLPTEKFISILTGNMLDDKLTQADINIFSAIRKNNPKLLKKALVKGADPNSKYKYGTSALAYSIIMKKDIMLIKNLLDAGADPNTTDIRGIPVLSTLAIGLKTSETYTDNILFNGLRVPNTEKKNNSTLTEYVKLNTELTNIKETLKLLLDAGADPNIKCNNKNPKNETRLEYDLSCGLPLNILKSYMDIYWDKTYCQERTFHYNTIVPEWEKSKSLIEDIFKMMLDKGLDPNYKIDSNNSLINVASGCNLNSILKMLINAGVDLTLYNNSNESPILWAIPEGKGWRNYTREFIQSIFKLNRIEPYRPVGLQYNERGMSDFELNEKLQAIKDTVLLLYENGLTLPVNKINDIIKSESVYVTFKDLGNFILNAESYVLSVNKLEAEDSKNSIKINYEYNL